MLLMGQQLIGKPIMSLRTGGQIGSVESIIINPNNLKIEGWFAKANSHKQPRILLSQDVRDIIEQGFVVDDHESLTDPEELVRLSAILQLKFELVGKPVITKRKNRLGKINDFAFEKNAFFIQKLYVSQSIMKSFSGGAAIVDRTQIVEINNRNIIVAEATVPSKTSVVPAANQPVMNPAQP